MYAIIEKKGQQYKISEGDLLDLNFIDVKEGSVVEVKEILLTKNQDTVRVGMPYVKDSLARLKVVSQYKGEKLDVSKFKAKSKYRRKMGFRPKLTKVKVESITIKN